VLFDKGDVISSPDWRSLHESYVRSIASVDFPEGSGALTLREKFQHPDKQWDRNGVLYLKNRFLDHMERVEGWEAEAKVNLSAGREQPAIRLYPSLEPYREPITSDFGGFDLMTAAANGTRIAIEWETGNVSSSHRSMNKLAISLGAGIIEVGVMIVPSREFYSHLTDRIGNIGELSGYLAMWESMKFSVNRGLLALSVVEHDHLTRDEGHPYLPRGSDGRAKEGRAKRSH